ncbi:putative ion transporter superfamily protein YfcC [Sedimentibacter acidaminivorans]|uniref:Ion transporter superfamily protein YfcC n=1 Tax=Sedimentibacter acidaminivorans TaxID=913099 RepID=A0ABS4GEH0_9FIRM|nr:YfcC family protein [Sedimentibacter acidaminivorans]MBP1926084.1 putative ion transporter superfamily protein YfcC [Sedimentibacter acidaminivorans]
MSDVINKEKKKKFPHVYVILLTVVVICAILTYFVPAGQYDMVENADGRMVVNPDSFHYVESSPVSFFGVLNSVPKGMVETAGIIFFIFIVGGSFAVIQATGAIEAGLGKITKTMAGKEKAIIPIVMLVFSLGGAIFGMAEETLPFIPIMVTLSIALGFDSLTGVGIVLAGAGAGFAGAFMNPFTVGVAQGIAGLPLFSGMGFRIIAYLSVVSVAIGFMYIYAGRVKKNPELSSMYEFDKTREDILDLNKIRDLNLNDKLVLLAVGLTIVLLVFGVVKYGWYIQEISALFLGMAIVVALLGKLGFNGFAENLVDGMANMAGGALVVGFARAILVVLTEGTILDTILYVTSNAVSNLPSSLTALGMYIFQCLLNFIVPSGSGQAAVSIPIMAPLADLVGVTRQTAVLAYQFGDGISNIFTPTSGYFMAGLALAKVPWNKWAKWIIPMILLEYLVGGIFVFIAHYIQFGPF